MKDFNYAKYNTIKKAIKAKYPEMSEKAIQVRAQRAYRSDMAKAAAKAEIAVATEA